MNEQTEKLIRDLSDKLGTTIEHLWDVLIKQAFITGITNLILGIVFTSVLIFSARALNKFSEEEDPFSPITTLLGLIFVIVLLLYIIMVFNISNLIVGPLLNPEYWALKQIIP